MHQDWVLSLSKSFSILTGGGQETQLFSIIRIIHIKIRIINEIQIACFLFFFFFSPASGIHWISFLCLFWSLQTCRCGTEGCGLVGLVVMGWWLDSVILVVFSNLNAHMKRKSTVVVAFSPHWSNVTVWHTILVPLSCISNSFKPKLWKLLKKSSFCWIVWDRKFFTTGSKLHVISSFLKNGTSGRCAFE